MSSSDCASSKGPSTVTQPFAPVFNAESRILILGSLPSAASRQNGFYYGHPRNRFWKLLAALSDSPLPQSIEEKKAFLLARHIALYDAIESCSIQGSSDASISQSVPADLGPILAVAPIEAVFCNGKAARKALENNPSLPSALPVFTLPSTSPANAAFSLDRLAKAWKAAFEEAGFAV